MPSQPPRHSSRWSRVRAETVQRPCRGSKGGAGAGRRGAVWAAPSPPLVPGISALSACWACPSVLPAQDRGLQSQPLPSRGSCWPFSEALSGDSCLHAAPQLPGVDEASGSLGLSLGGGDFGPSGFCPWAAGILGRWDSVPGRCSAGSFRSSPSHIAAPWLQNMVNIYDFQRNQLFYRENMFVVRCFHLGKVEELFLGQRPPAMEVPRNPAAAALRTFLPREGLVKGQACSLAACKLLVRASPLPGSCGAADSTLAAQRVLGAKCDDSPELCHMSAEGHCVSRCRGTFSCSSGLDCGAFPPAWA